MGNEVEKEHDFNDNNDKLVDVGWPFCAVNEDKEEDTCRNNMIMGEENEEIVPDEAVLQATKPDLVEAKVLVPTYYTFQTDKFAKVFNVEEEGNLQYNISILFSKPCNI